MYPYLMAGICLISALLLILKLGRENKLYYGLGAFLILLGGWVLADKLTDGALSGSWAIWLQRAVLAVVIVVLIIIMVRDMRASAADLPETQGDPDEEAPDELDDDADEDTQDDANTEEETEV